MPPKYLPESQPEMKRTAGAEMKGNFTTSGTTINVSRFQIFWHTQEGEEIGFETRVTYEIDLSVQRDGEEAKEGKYATETPEYRDRRAAGAHLKEAIMVADDTMDDEKRDFIRALLDDVYDHQSFPPKE